MTEGEMKYEEAKAHLSHIKKGFACVLEFGSVEEAINHYNDLQDIETILEAIEKQIPKKTIADTDFPTLKFCPNCNECLDVNGVNHFPYCAECGQAIDWSEEND